MHRAKVLAENGARNKEPWLEMLFLFTGRVKKNNNKKVNEERFARKRCTNVLSGDNQKAICSMQEGS